MEDVEPESSDADDGVTTDNLIFNGLTAWFSQSVRNSLQQKWGVLKECYSFSKFYDSLMQD
jgi:hypothetical protein